MIEDIGLRFDNQGEGVPIPLQVWDEDFDRAVRAMLSGFTDTRREDTRAAIGEVIPVDGSDHHMLELQVANRLPESSRFIDIDSRRLPLGDSTVHATAGTHITQDHKRDGAALPALTDIWTSGFLTNGVQFK